MSNQALRDLANELRALTERNDSDAERCESAGRLLLAAIDFGAFAERPSLVAMVRQRAEQDNVNGPISAWVEALRVLMGRDEPSMGAFDDDVATVAEMIEACAESQDDGHVGEMSPEASEATHAPDFTSVNWFGMHYTFTKGQAAAVRALWEAWEAGGHSLNQETIGENANSASDRYRLDVVFRDHPAWGTMIRRVKKGVFRLTPPDQYQKF